MSEPLADIVPFAARRATGTREHRATSAEIVIFPGVRIEYHDAQPTPPAKRKRARRSTAPTILSA